MDTALQDLRFGIRTLARMPGFALTAALTLGIGIAATTTMFSLAYAVLFRPLPFERSSELMLLQVTRTSPRFGTERARWSYPEIQDLPAALTAFESLGSFTLANVNVTGGESNEQLDAEAAASGYFRVVRAPAAAGRVFDAADEHRPVALISDRLWRRRFGSDPAILGRAIVLNDVPLTIVGVMPPGFAGLTGRADVWFPPPMAAELTYRDYLTTPQHFINVVGRLRPGVSPTQADAEIAARAPRIVRKESSSDPSTVWGATVRPLASARIDPATSRPIVILFAAVACVLLVSCVNIASLLLARGSSRRREVAVRMAIGSSRWRVIRQLLTESALLALLGGFVGLILTVWSVDAIGAPATVATARNGYLQLGAFSEPAVDATVLVFAVAATFATVFLCGLMPAIEVSRPDVVAALKEESRSGGSRHRRLLSTLVITELALAVLLIGVAGLLIRSFVRMQDLRSGFVADRVMAFLVNPPASRYAPEDGPAIVERMLTAVQAVPGVSAAAVNRCLPLDTRCARTVLFLPNGSRNPAEAPTIGRHYISADYFRALGIPVVAGRPLRDDDREGRPRVTVINETAARRFWPGEDPIGKRVWFGGGRGFTDPAQPLEVVGVVGDVKYGLVDDPPTADFYTSYLQFTYPDTMIIVKAEQPAAATASAVRTAIARVDPSLVAYDIRTLDDRVTEALSRPRLTATVLGAFALTALLLAAIGVYGVTAYAVTTRRRELGIRVALGATRSDMMAFVLGGGLKLAVAGVAIGLVAAVVAGRLIRTLLYGVAPLDVLVLVTTVAIMISVALLACFVPARRAASVNPVEALRAE
jgi:putative ABC transport system permease protein